MITQTDIHDCRLQNITIKCFALMKSVLFSLRLCLGSLSGHPVYILHISQYLKGPILSPKIEIRPAGTKE